MTVLELDHLWLLTIKASRDPVKSGGSQDPKDTKYLSVLSKCETYLPFIGGMLLGYKQGMF